MRKFFVLFEFFLLVLFFSSNQVLANAPLPTSSIDTLSYIVINGTSRQLVSSGNNVWWRDSGGIWQSGNLANYWPANLFPANHPLPTSLDSISFQHFPACNVSYMEILIKGGDVWYRLSADGSFSHTTLLVNWGIAGPPTNYINSHSYDLHNNTPRELVTQGGTVWYRTMNCATGTWGSWGSQPLTLAWNSSTNPPPSSGSYEVFTNDYVSSTATEHVVAGTTVWKRQSTNRDSINFPASWQIQTLADFLGSSPALPSPTPNSTPILPPLTVIYPQDNLVSHWTFDENNGSVTIIDKIGSNNGVANAGIAVAEGKSLFARSFDRSNHGYIEIPNSGPFNFEWNEPFTFSAWLKPRNFFQYTQIVQKHGASTGGFGLRLDAGKPAFFLDSKSTNTAGIYIRAEDELMPGVWQHLAMTYDGTGAPSGIKLYLDGVVLPVKILITSNMSGSSIKNSATLKIGGSAEGEENFDGSIDEVAIWKRVLSENDILGVYGEIALKNVQSRYVLKPNIALNVALFCQSATPGDTFIYSMANYSWTPRDVDRGTTRNITFDCTSQITGLRKEMISTLVVENRTDVGSDQTILVNEKPFFPVGFWMNSMSATTSGYLLQYDIPSADWRDLANSGINLTLLNFQPPPNLYKPIDKFRELVHSEGIKIALIAYPLKNIQDSVSEFRKAKLLEPALFGYYTFDEPVSFFGCNVTDLNKIIYDQSGTFGQIYGFYQTLKTLDPNHVSWSNMASGGCDYITLDEYKEQGVFWNTNAKVNITGVDFYNTVGGFRFFDQPGWVTWAKDLAAQTAISSGKPIATIMIISGFPSIGTLKDRLFNAVSAIVHGANGIVFFC